ncbi:hypothetical protein [Amycolatopsis sp. GM8]|uniref:hypothetical protein n=1 Tax=Amycolatopsis sp. GM8 TaxID=2896530 RepID=UPI001F3A2FC5|nr:hypothetical protein [Amycolatopsis sp. GM8]
MKRLIGANPAHLLVLLPCLALAAYAGSFLLGDPTLLTILIWFVGAAIAHDLVLFPLYALIDRGLRKITWHPKVRAVNHIRIPVLGTGLTFLLFLPGIIGQGEATHLAATGLTQGPYLGRWLWLVLGMFAASGLVYLIRLGKTARRRG